MNTTKTSKKAFKFPRLVSIGTLGKRLQHFLVAHGVPGRLRKIGSTQFGARRQYYCGMRGRSREIRGDNQQHHSGSHRQARSESSNIFQNAAAESARSFSSRILAITFQETWGEHRLRVPMTVASTIRRVARSRSPWCSARIRADAKPLPHPLRHSNSLPDERRTLTSTCVSVCPNIPVTPSLLGSATSNRVCFSKRFRYTSTRRSRARNSLAFTVFTFKPKSSPISHGKPFHFLHY